MCADCPKCTHLGSPQFDLLTTDRLVLRFEFYIILDSLKLPHVQLIRVDPLMFTELVNPTLLGSPGQVIATSPDQLFRPLFAQHLRKIGFFEDRAQFFVSFLKDQLRHLQILDHIVDLDNVRKTGYNFVHNSSVWTSTQFSSPSSVSSADGDPLNFSCGSIQIFNILLVPQNIRAGINGYLSDSMNIFIISKPECVTQSVDLGPITQDISLSLMFLLVSHYLRMPLP